MHELDARGAPGFETIALASLSDAGRVRAENQDSVALLENTSRERLLLIADGMGGHRGGETASRICMRTIERVFREPHGTPEQRLIRGIELANEEVYSHALANPELRGMGTTVVVALLAPGGGAWVAWVGDSRLYRYREGKLEQLTQDHSLMAEWITIGVITADAARTHPRRHELTRALGQTPDVVVDLLPIELHPGDRFLLCSDGLHGCVTDTVLARALKVGVPDVAVCALVDAANANGGPDNVSVIVAVLPDTPEPASPPEPESTFVTAPEDVTAPWPVPQPVPEPISEPVSEPEPEAGLELGFEPALDAARGLEPEPEPEPESEPEPEPESEAAKCAPEIAAELCALDPHQTLAEPEAPAVVQAEASFADLGAELIAQTQETAEPEAEPAFSLSLEREPFPTPSGPIQIPRMTPIGARRGLDVTSFVVGVTTTLVVVGLGLALWSYTASRSAPESSAAQQQPPKIVRTAPSQPAPRSTPAPAEQRIDKPAPPEIAPETKPEIAKLSDPTPPREVLPEPGTLTTFSATPEPAVPHASQPRSLPTQPSVPAAPDAATEQSPASVAKFELTPAVERFLTAWLGALAAEDRARLAALGFPDEPIALAGTPGSRDGFLLVAADIDEERSGAGRVYLRVIVSYAFRDANGRYRTQDEQRFILSYAFRDANGRYRTQDEQRFILNDVGGGLRFEGRWRQ